MVFRVTWHFLCVSHPVSFTPNERAAALPADHFAYTIETTRCRKTDQGKKVRKETAWHFLYSLTHRAPTIMKCFSSSRGFGSFDPELPGAQVRGRAMKIQTEWHFPRRIGLVEGKMLPRWKPFRMGNDKVQWQHHTFNMILFTVKGCDLCVKETWAPPQTFR